MSRRILLCLRGPGLAALLFGVPQAAPARDASDPSEASLTAPVWTELAPGLSFARVQARRYCRAGSPGVAAVRVDPARCWIAPYHESEFTTPATVEAWQERLQAPVVLNAGLYDQDRRHLGLLRRRGQDLGGNRHGSWKGVLVFDPREPNLPLATVLDLSSPEDQLLEPRYDTAVQSMMLLDRSGEIRVRKSDRLARRSAVALDQTGRILLLVTEGTYTLWESGALLRESGWDLVEAIALDGGNEATLIVNANRVHYRTFENDSESAYTALVTLPSILAVEPREARGK
jgi:uncharacterized protein YigE (DUF2233 family)